MCKSPGSGNEVVNRLVRFPSVLHRVKSVDPKVYVHPQLAFKKSHRFSSNLFYCSVRSLVFRYLNPWFPIPWQIFLACLVLSVISVTGTVLPKQVADILDEFNRVSIVKAIPVDNTNANTVCEGRLVTLLEKSSTEISLMVVPCTKMNFHLELFLIPQKALHQFNGPLGKSCGKIHTQLSFSAVGSHLDSSFTFENKDILSRDQRLLYEL